MATGTINLPAGFELEEEPQRSAINLPDGFELEQQQPSILETGTPEKPENIIAQFNDMQDPNTGRDAVFVGRYTQNPIEKLPLGSNIRRVESPAGVLYTTNKDKAAKYEQNPTDDVRAEVLGYNEPKSQILSSGKPASAVVVVTDSNGHSLFEEATTDPSGVIEKYQKRGYKNVAVKTPAQVQMDRLSWTPDGVGQPQTVTIAPSSGRSATSGLTKMERLGRDIKTIGQAAKQIVTNDQYAAKPGEIYDIVTNIRDRIFSPLAYLMPGVSCKDLIASLDKQAEDFSGFGSALAPAAGEAGQMAVELGAFQKAFSGLSKVAAKAGELPRVKQVADAINQMGGVKQFAEKFPRIFQATKTGLKDFAVADVIGQGYGALKATDEDKSGWEFFKDMQKEGATAGAWAGAFSVAGSADRALYVKNLRTEMLKKFDVQLQNKVAEINKSGMSNIEKSRAIKGLAGLRNNGLQYIDSVAASVESDLTNFAKGELYPNIRDKVVNISPEKAAARFMRVGYETGRMMPKAPEQLKTGIGTSPKTEVLADEPVTRAGEILKAIRRPVETVKETIKEVKESASKPQSVSEFAQPPKKQTHTPVAVEPEAKGTVQSTPAVVDTEISSNPVVPNWNPELKKQGEEVMPYKQTRDEFIQTHRKSFKMNEGQRTPRLLQLSKTETTPIGNYFKNGKPIKPIDDILGEIYDTRIKPRIGKPSFMEKLKADIASNQKSATIPSMAEKPLPQWKKVLQEFGGEEKLSQRTKTAVSKLEKAGAIEHFQIDPVSGKWQLNLTKEAGITAGIWGDDAHYESAKNLGSTNKTERLEQWAEELENQNKSGTLLPMPKNIKPAKHKAGDRVFVDTSTGETVLGTVSKTWQSEGTDTQLADNMYEIQPDNPNRKPLIVYESMTTIRPMSEKPAARDNIEPSKQQPSGNDGQSLANKGETVFVDGTLYHNTDRESAEDIIENGFKTESTENLSSQERALVSGNLGDGIYFSPDYQANMDKWGGDTNIQIKLKKPLKLYNLGESEGSARHMTPQKADELKKQGYDGIIVNDPNPQSGGFQVVIFNPKNLKKGIIVEDSDVDTDTREINIAPQDTAEAGKLNFKSEAKHGGKIVQMSPDEYIDRIHSFNNLSQEQIVKEEETSLKHGGKGMAYLPPLSEGSLNSLRKGGNIDAPFLDYSRGGRVSQEGYHRTLIAKEQGQKTIPVEVIGDLPEIKHRGLSEIKNTGNKSSFNTTAPEDRGKSKPTKPKRRASKIDAIEESPEQKKWRKNEIRNTTAWIKNHDLYRVASEAAGYQQEQLPIKEYVVALTRDSIPQEITDYIGKPGHKGYKGYLWKYIKTRDVIGRGVMSWDEAAEQAGITGGEGEFVRALDSAIQKQKNKGLNKSFVENSLKAGNPEFEWQITKLYLLENGKTVDEIADEEVQFYKELENEYKREQLNQGNGQISTEAPQAVQPEESTDEQWLNEQNEQKIIDDIDNFFYNIEDVTIPENTHQTETNLFGESRPVLQGGATGKQTEMFSRDDYKTEQTKQAEESARLDIDGQMKLDSVKRWPVANIEYASDTDPSIYMDSRSAGFAGFGRPQASAKVSAIVKENMSTGSVAIDDFLNRTKNTTKANNGVHPLKKAAAGLAKFVRNFHFLPELPKTESFAKVREAFRHLMEVSKMSYNDAVEAMRWALEPIEGTMQEVMKRVQAVIMKIIADDLAEDVSNNLELPPGIEAKDVYAMKQRADELYNTYPSVREAYDRIRQKCKEITDMLVEEGWLDPERAKEFYYPHKIIKYLRNNDAFLGIGKQPAIPRKAYLKQRKGGADYSTDVLERFIEHWAQVRRDIETTRFIEKVLKEEQDNYFKKEFPEWTEYTKTEDGKKVRNPIPAGYKEVNVLPGRFYYKANGVTEDLAMALLSNNLAEIEAVLRDQGLEGKMPIRTMLALGKKRSFIVREEIAKQLNDMPTVPVGADNGLYQAIKNTNTFVKRNILFNPLYAVPFHVTNLVGDAQKVAVATPKAFVDTGVVNYWKSIIATHNGEKPEIFSEAQKRGVIGAGWIAADVKKAEALIPIIERAELSGAGQVLFNKIKRLYNEIEALGESREDWLRYAVFEHLVNLQNKGVDIARYAVKDTAVVRGLSGYDKAAKIARDILGDYSAIGKSGQMLSDLAMPFYRWMHLNLPWWPRMIKEYAKRGDAGRLVAALLAATAPYIAAMLWNYSDDERRKYEQSLPYWKRCNFHIVSLHGKTMYYVPLPTDDVLNFFGVPETALDFQRYQRGMINAAGLWKRIAINMTYEPAMQTVNAVGGVAGVIRDLIGIQTYPDFKPYLEKRWSVKGLRAIEDVFGAPGQLVDSIAKGEIRIDGETNQFVLSQHAKDMLNRSWMGIRTYNVDLAKSREMLENSIYKNNEKGHKKGDRYRDGRTIKGNKYYKTTVEPHKKGDAHKGKERLVDSLKIQLEGSK